VGPVVDGGSWLTIAVQLGFVVGAVASNAFRYGRQ